MTQSDPEDSKQNTVIVPAGGSAKDGEVQSAASAAAPADGVADAAATATAPASCAAAESAAPAPDCRAETAATPVEAEADAMQNLNVPSKRRWFRRWQFAVGGAFVLLLLLIWGGTALATTQHLFSGSTISGVAVGSMNPAQARDKVTKQLTASLNNAVTLQVTQNSVQLVPAQAGVSIDAGASVARLTSFTLNPVTIVRRLQGQAVTAVTRVDEAQLTKALNDQLTALSAGAQDATVTLSGTTAVLTPAVAGTGVDVKASVRQLAAAWPLGKNPITLVEGTTQPAITDAKAQAFIDDVLTPLLSADLTVTTAGTQVAGDQPAQAVFTPADTAAMVSISAQDGALNASLDPAKVHDYVVGAVGAVETAATNATYTIDASASGQPTYVAGAPGSAIDAQALAAQLLQAGTQGTDAAARTVVLPLTTTAPEHNEAAADLGVSQIVGEYATPFYYDPVRTQNLTAGTQAINGTLVRAGETFSLEQALGTVDAEHGFAAAGVISGGVHSEAMGGGLSQVATTAFNAGFEAGMDDVEHHPHSVWFTRYPAGREATLWTGNLDMKWKNSTPYAVLVQAWVADSQVHVRLWSTPYYQVSITSGEKTNYRAVQTKHSAAADCEPYSGGQAGFDITVTRNRTTPDGSALAPDVLTTSYAADDALVCLPAGNSQPVQTETS